jgi:hypothetical protein
MALPDLAAEADLSARGVDVSNTALVAVMLAAASAVVRAACQSPVLETTSTVSLWATDDDRYLDLPGKPVMAVSAVAVDGTTVTDHKLVNGRLWRLCGWGWCGEPTPVEVTLTHGFTVVPADVKALVVDLAIAGMDAATEGAHSPNKIAERIDDYSVTWAAGADVVASAMELPKATKAALRARFGGGVALVASR